MFKVISLLEAKSLIHSRFGQLRVATESVKMNDAIGRFLAEDISSTEFVPAFDRSTVDGFAVVSRDLRGCSDSIPAILRKTGESLMGIMPTHFLQPGECFYVPTGGALPQGADAMVMIEFAEDFGAGELAFVKPVPPGANMIFKGEDLKPGDLILPRGKQLNPADIEQIEAWRQRPLEGQYPYVYLDGAYLKRNWGGHYGNVAVLVAMAGE